MDPSTLLDHALFHLTPTRTRCDLIAVPLPSAGAPQREKIASGLFEPFLAHLRAARELLPKGGYSFTLRPSSPPPPVPWLTRSTLEKFVRFVTSPEILERAVTIEKEIVQIEDSIYKEDLSPASVANGAAKKLASAPSKGSEDLGKEDVVQKENSKICLVRVLENRKMMLLKEQGMAYARASVAGFEKGNIDNLICFADAFGADRLREACVNFKELCNEKEQDKLWMDELAALEAQRAAQLAYLGVSGVGEVNADGPLEKNGADDSVRNHMSKAPGSIPWNSVPHMYNFQNSGIPGSTPFPGYAFPYPGMQMIPPYSGYTENFHWSHRGDEKDVDGSRSRGMPEKLHRSAETTRSSRNTYSDNDSSNSESEPDEHHVATDADSSKKSHRHRKSKKKSSRTVVIRNINYISNGRHGEDGSSDKSSEDDLIDGDSLRRQVEDIVGSFGEHQNSSRQHAKSKGDRRKSGGANVSTESDDNKVVEDGTSPRNSKAKNGGGWDAFQNILMRDDSHPDELNAGIKNAHVEGNNLRQVDVAGEYCFIKNGEMLSSSTARYQLQNELGKGIKARISTNDPLIDSTMGVNSIGNGSLGNFEPLESNGRSIKRTHNSGEDFLFSGRMNPEINTHEALSNISDESSTYRGRRDGDWFLASGSEGQFVREGSINHMNFDGERFVKTENNSVHKEKTRMDVAVDDSFIASVRDVVVEEQQSSLWETDMNIISGAAIGGPNNNASITSKETRKPEFYEPEELQLVLERHTEVPDVHASWTPEIEFTSITKENKPIIEDIKPIPSNEKTPPAVKVTKAKSQIPPKTSITSRSATKNKLDALSRPKAISAVSRKGTTMSKAEKEEADRKRIEELRIEREKRIAQRSATSKLNSTERRTSLGKLPSAPSAKQHGFGYAAKFSADKVTAK